MPTFIRADQRVRYESIALTTEIMELNLGSLFALANAGTVKNPDNPPFTQAERASMISFAWGIVDQADLLRRLIQAEGKAIDLRSAADFLTAAKVVRQLRNWMDHLPERLPNFLKQSGGLPPAHGALSFTYVHPDDATVSAETGRLHPYRAIVILSCAMHRDLLVSGEPVKYEKFGVPIDHFVLQSFGHNLPLIDLVNLATKFCDEFGGRVAKICNDKAAEIAVAEDRPLDDVMRASTQLAGTLVMIATPIADL